MKMIVESMMECTLARETEILGENLPQRHFFPSQNGYVIAGRRFQSRQSNVERSKTSSHLAATGRRNAVISNYLIELL
jgi:hypothetical protein